jgi:hypothetical protein
MMALAADGQARQPRAFGVEQTNQVGGQFLGRIASCSESEFRERCFGPAFLAGEEPRVTRQECPGPIDLQPPTRAAA